MFCRPRLRASESACSFRAARAFSSGEGATEVLESLGGGGGGGRSGFWTPGTIGNSSGLL
jgi:hypothetical protein